MSQPDALTQGSAGFNLAIGTYRSLMREILQFINNSQVSQCFKTGIFKSLHALTLMLYLLSTNISMTTSCVC